MPDDLVKKWNYLKDGNFTVIGMQYIISPFAKIALNYQGIVPNFIAADGNRYNIPESAL